MSDSDRLRRDLRWVLRDLGQIHSAIAVAVAALKQQASELDEDIAHVLQRGAADRIHEQMERIERVLEALPGDQETSVVL